MYYLDFFEILIEAIRLVTTESCDSVPFYTSLTSRLTIRCINYHKKKKIMPAFQIKFLSGVFMVLLIAVVFRSII